MEQLPIVDVDKLSVIRPPFWLSSTIEVVPNRRNWPLRASSLRQGQIMRVLKMKPYDLKSMSMDELWSLHEFVSSALARRISAETERLNQRLRQLGLGALPHNVKKTSHARRPYPKVFPKYRNPAKPSETWAGRGKKPRWLTAQLKSGKRIDDFRIVLAAA